ncbi:sodium transport system ATP-binding protein [Ruminococcaceae bacterium YRB3002]|nr:sodium transport system ATP-binding protein [Ruminococcaceae bacterium YRB3002]
MIEVIDVKKRYSSAHMIVKGVSFTVKPGMIYGLLGPNGAGKTTLMQMMATLLKPTEGTIRICGTDIAKDPLAVHKQIGFLTTEVKLDPLSTPNRLYDFFANLYDLPKEGLDQKKREDFGRFGITPFADKRIVELSTGMKQKISICISLIHEPPVIIFDEPTNGLDILTSKQVTDYLKYLRKEGRTIILSTHIFSLADSLCDEIGVLVDGNIVASGTSQELCKLTGQATFEDAFFKLYSDNHKEG